MPTADLAQGDLARADHARDQPRLRMTSLEAGGGNFEARSSHTRLTRARSPRRGARARIRPAVCSDMRTTDHGGACPQGYFLESIRAGACELSRAPGLGKGYGFVPFAFMPWPNTRIGASSLKARRRHRGRLPPLAGIWRLRGEKRRPVPRPLVILEADAPSCGASCSRDVEGAPRAAAPDDEYEAPARQRLAPEGERWRCRAAPPCLCAERQRRLESDLYLKSALVSTIC